MEVSISTDKEKLDIAHIHNYISNVSYWGRGRTLEEVKTTISHSLCFGMYTHEGTQVGFGRVVTDHVIFAYLMDIIIFEDFQKRGLGKTLIQNILEHEVLRKVKTVLLKTKDAHTLYEAYGFSKIGNSDLWMAMDKVLLL
jgi:N-acetylglutamate synthase-like GNAT family acetyltransferase